MSGWLAPYHLARRVGDVLDACNVPWVVVGSLASSVHGMPRSTHDVDLVAVLDVFDRDALVSRLAPMGYVDADVVMTAIERRRSFNFIDDATSEKVDVFCIAADRAGQIERARLTEIEPGLVVPILSPEDTVAQKLRWFELGGRSSDRQWRDIVEVVRVQGAHLDRPLLEALAGELGVEELLAQALSDARGPRA